jgi:hypothetical protein
MKAATMVLIVIAVALVVGCSRREGPQALADRSQAAPTFALTPPPEAASPSDESPIPRPAQFSVNQDPKVMEAVKQRGARTAVADIKAGKLRILEYGASHASIDAQTGLPTFPVPCCDMTGQVWAELEAYNQVMRDRHATHRDLR